MEKPIRFFHYAVSFQTFRFVRVYARFGPVHFVIERTKRIRQRTSLEGGRQGLIVVQGVPKKPAFCPFWANFSKKIFFSNFFLMTFTGVILCEKSIPRIPES